MNTDTRRITLISQLQQQPQRSWHRSSDAASKIILVDLLKMLSYTVSSPLVHVETDVERIILDRCASASDFLGFMAGLPQEFVGDVLMIRDDLTGYLSAMGRGGDRILYALSTQDLDFYLETNDLLDPNSEAKAVLQFRPRAIAAAVA